MRAVRAGRIGFGVATGILVWPSLCRADLVWPALVLLPYLLSVPAILFGLAAEIAILALALECSWRRAALAGVTMNAVSTVVGAVLIPLAGVAWEFFPGLVMYRVFGVGTFNPLTWTATFLLAALVNALIEMSVLRVAFGIPFGGRLFRLLVLANCASVSVAYLAMWWSPPEY